jgi:hypothetical protein
VLNNLEDVRSQQRAEEAALESELLVRLGQVRVDLELLESQLRSSGRGGNGRVREAAAIPEG